MKKNNTAEIDRYFLKKALLLAKKNLGLTGLKPSVGCLIVDDNSFVVAGSATQAIAVESSSFFDADQNNYSLNQSGCCCSNKSILHAEELAFKKISTQTKLTVYITLEPCNFRSDKSMKSCLDIILANKEKIKRVVIGIADPNPKVNGRSIASLLDNGVSVETNSCENKITDFYQGYILRYNNSRPKVCLKLATDINGKLGIRGKSLWLSNELAVKYSHYLRARFDAIIIGSNTLRIDKPILNVRTNGLESASPLKIWLISKKQDLYLKSVDHNTIIFYNDVIKLKSDDLKKLKSAYKLFPIKKENNNNFCLETILTLLAKQGISNLLLEGGAKLAASFLKQNLIDEMQIITTPALLRYDEKKLVPSFDHNIICNNTLQKFKLISNFILDNDVVNIYKSK